MHADSCLSMRMQQATAALLIVDTARCTLRRTAAQAQLAASQADVARVTTEVEQSEGDVDLLLTCEWPADVAGGLPAASLPAGVETPSSDAVARLAVSVRPR
jgi:hypothetical protein